MGSRKSKEIDVVVEKMVFEGKGLAHHEGRVVFLEGALPGERVKARVFKRKKSYWFAKALEILEPSPLRHEAPCPSFGKCGGCSYLDCAYEAQLEFKAGFIKEALYGLPGAESVIQPVMPVEYPFEYRNKMVYSFGMQDDKPVMGMHLRGDFARVVTAGECRLQSADARDIVRRTEAFFSETDAPIFNEFTKEGVFRDLMVREGKFTGQRLFQINCTAPHPIIKELPELYGDLCDTFLVGIDPNGNGPPRPTSYDVLTGSGVIEEELNGFRFEIGPDTFFQTNSRQAARLFKLIESWAADVHPKSALDLYSGVGPIAMHISRVAENVVALESNSASVEAAEINLRKNNIQNVQTICSAAEKTGKMNLPEVDLIVVDPPRPGLHEKVRGAILEAAPASIIYVSCNPATLARDLNEFCESAYSIDIVQPVDMFPHTFHVETVTRLKRKK